MVDKLIEFILILFEEMRRGVTKKSVWEIKK